jgi:signal transduction histidine kinase
VPAQSLTHKMTAADVLADHKRPLLRLAKALTPCAEEATQLWRAIVTRLGSSPEEVAALAALDPTPHLTALTAGRIDAYQATYERAGQTLAARGVPEENAVSALGAYFDLLLPHVDADVALVSAAQRVILAAQLALIAGYGSTRASSWRAVEDKERQRLSRDLHDEIGHNLIVLKLYLEMIKGDVDKGHTGQVGQKIDEALNLVAGGIDSVRRLILDLGPAILDEVGLLPAIKQYARQFQARTGMTITVQESNLPGNLPSSYETTLYRVLQGALSNVVRHARAKHVKISLGSAREAVIVMIIEDDGVGFDVVRKTAGPAFGLSAMRERVESLGGRIQVESRPSRAGGRRPGTRIEVDLPLWGTAAVT